MISLQKSKTQRETKRSVILYLFTLYALGFALLYLKKQCTSDNTLTPKIQYRSLLSTSSCNLTDSCSVCNSKCSLLPDTSQCVSDSCTDSPFRIGCTKVENDCINPNTRYKIPGFYPHDLFTFTQLKQGAVVLHMLGLFYMFLAIAIVCDEFFVPAIDVIVERLHMSPNTAGATFMAAGGSAPELFTSIIGTFISRDEVGFGTIVGSAVFNVLFVIGCCAVFSSIPLKLTWYPFARDALYYCVSLIMLAVFFFDKDIWWYESLVLLVMYIMYVAYMMNNERIYYWLDARFGWSKKSSNPRDRADTQLRAMRRIGFNVSLFRLMTGDNVSDIASAHLMRLHKGDIRATFRMVDTDGNGYIDHDELKEVLARLGDHAITPEDLEQCWNELDENDDGKIEFHEFEHWFLQSQQRIMANVEITFDRFDLNGDGKLDTNELRALLTEIDHGREPTKQELDSAKAELDTDGDGLITCEEFTSWYREVLYKRREAVPDAKESAPLLDSEDKKTKAENKEKNKPENEDEDEEDEGISLAFPKTCCAGILYVVNAPIVIPLYFTIPDVRKKKFQKCYPVSFVMSILWLGVYSYMMVWWATTFGKVVGIPSKVMGLTLLAAGTSVPDLITSVIVAKKGEGDMAVSSSIGSNIFDILVGLPLPWFFYAVTLGTKEVGSPKIKVVANSLLLSIFILFAMLFIVLVLIMCNKWVMTKKLGCSMFILYFIFVIQDLLRSYNVF